MTNEWSKRGKKWRAGQMAGFAKLYGAVDAPIEPATLTPLINPPIRTKAVKKPRSEAVDAPKVPTEQQEQFVFAHWLRVHKIRFYHPPNGGKLGEMVGAKLKRLGVSPGVPDIVIPIPSSGYHSLYIELKRLKGGSVSPEQKEWVAWLNLNGHRAVICKGADAAIAVVKEYLGM